MIRVLPLRTPTLPPATHTNCYRLGDTVIDPASPYPEEQERLVAWLGDGVRRILLTHHHHDHIGGVVALAAATGAEVWAHADARLPFPVDVRVDDGDRIDTGDGVLVCWHTPGHADGHLAFSVEGGDILIGGDLVAGEGTIVLVPPEGHLATYLDSLTRMRTVASTVLPAHGPPLALPDAFDHYRVHRHHRTDQIVAAIAAGSHTPERIAARIYADIPGVNLALAAIQVTTHLLWLLERQRVRCTADGFVLSVPA